MNEASNLPERPPVNYETQAAGVKFDLSMSDMATAYVIMRLTYLAREHARLYFCKMSEEEWGEVEMHFADKLKRITKSEPPKKQKPTR